MKHLIKYIYILSLGILLMGCSQTELTIKEAELTDNEEILFDSIGKETYLFDLEGELKKGKAMSVGVEEYIYGELKDDRVLLSLGKSANEDEERVEENYKKLFIMLNEDDDSQMSVDVRVSSESGFYSLASAEIGSINVEEKAYSSDENIGEEALNLMGENEEDERTYIAHLAISPNGAFRSFDIEHAIQPNDDYEFLYLFYVETHDYEE
ncbi:hypothetical protein ACI2JA_09570 [Alkalihalobacillus sp. NPDC078783]